VWYASGGIALTPSLEKDTELPIGWGRGDIPHYHEPVREAWGECPSLLPGSTHLQSMLCCPVQSLDKCNHRSTMGPVTDVPRTCEWNIQVISELFCLSPACALGLEQNSHEDWFHSGWINQSAVKCRWT
jgi:hypothetical protein